MPSGVSPQGGAESSSGGLSSSAEIADPAFGQEWPRKSRRPAAGEPLPAADKPSLDCAHSVSPGGATAKQTWTPSLRTTRPCLSSTTAGSSSSIPHCGTA